MNHLSGTALGNPTPINRQFTGLNRLPLNLALGTFRAEFFNWAWVGEEWWKANKFRNRPHKHSFYEITYVQHGNGWFDTVGGRLDLSPGDLFIAKPSEPHEILSSSDHPLEIYFWSHTLIPSYSALQLVPEHLLNLYIHADKWVGNQHSAVAVLLNLLADEMLQARPGFPHAIQGLLITLMMETVRAVIPSVVDEEIEAATSVHHPHETTVKAMVRYLHDNYSAPIVVQDVASQVYLSERHASRLFRQSMGVSILHYLTSLRLEKAAELLMDSQLSVGEIAGQCGYTNSEYFTTLFRRRVGIVPTLYRQQGGTEFITD